MLFTPLLFAADDDDDEDEEEEEEEEEEEVDEGEGRKRMWGVANAASMSGRHTFAAPVGGSREMRWIPLMTRPGPVWAPPSGAA